ncbi:MAG: DUF3306 domain-containing protein [Rhodospirillales bacterium]
MNEDSESSVSRWSRLKSQGGESAPATETLEKPKNMGGAAPVAGRRIAPLMPPLAEPEEGEIEMEAAPPEALALKAQLEAEKAAREEDEAEEERELTPEEENAVKDLPPIESLTKDSDFTPFFAQNVPDFLKRQAYRVLWRSNPVFNIRDGLDDYDEDLNLAKLVGNIISESGSKPGQAGAGDETAKAGAPEKAVEADNKDAGDAEGDVGDGEDDMLGDGEDDMLGDGEEEIAQADTYEPGNVEEVEAEEDDKKRKEPGSSDVRLPDNAVK